MSYRRGHVTGHKREQPGATDWYKQHEAAILARIEREWAARQTPPQATNTPGAGRET